MSTDQLRKDVVGTLACVVGSNVGSFLDTKSPRLVTYRITSKPVTYVEEDTGEPLHNHAITETLHITFSLHPDMSVEGINTMEEAHTSKLWGGRDIKGHLPVFTAHCASSASGENEQAIICYDTELSVKDTEQSFTYIEDLEMRARLVERQPKLALTKLTSSKVCYMRFVFQGADAEESFTERAHVVIHKSPFRIAVSEWTRNAHFDFDTGCAAPVKFEVDTIELVEGVSVATPVFS